MERDPWDRIPIFSSFLRIAVSRHSILKISPPPGFPHLGEFPFPKTSRLGDFPLYEIPLSLETSHSKTPLTGEFPGSEAPLWKDSLLGDPPQIGGSSHSGDFPHSGVFLTLRTFLTLRKGSYPSSLRDDLATFHRLETQVVKIAKAGNLWWRLPASS